MYDFHAATIRQLLSLTPETGLHGGAVALLNDNIYLHLPAFRGLCRAG